MLDALKKYDFLPQFKNNEQCPRVKITKPTINLSKNQIKIDREDELKIFVSYFPLLHVINVLNAGNLCLVHRIITV